MAREELDLSSNRIFVWTRGADVSVLHNNVRALELGHPWANAPVALRRIRGQDGSFRLLSESDPRLEAHDVDDSVERVLAHAIMGMPLRADIRRRSTRLSQYDTDIAGVELNHQPDFFTRRRILLQGCYPEVPTDAQIDALATLVAEYASNFAVQQTVELP